MAKARQSTALYNIDRDGITQGLLGQFLDCRQKARWFLQGYSLKEGNLGLTFGTIAHAVLEKVYGDFQVKRIDGPPSDAILRAYLKPIERAWRNENSTASIRATEQLELALLLTEQVLPTYFEFWQGDDFRKIKWDKLERSFGLPFKLRNGRTVTIRGKMDGDFHVGSKLWLFETKTKSRIVEENLVDMLPMDRQVQMYMWALRQMTGEVPSGVLYNLIRRPQLRQKKDESIRGFAMRCAEDVRERASEYFIRLELCVTEQEMNRWEGEMDDLITDFINWWEGGVGHYRNTNMCETKYGRCEYLHLCAGRRMAPYYKRTKVFRELEDY